MNRTLRTVGNLIFTGIIGFMLYLVAFRGEELNFGVMRIWFGYIILMLMIQGNYIKFGHMTRSKLYYYHDNEHWEPSTWRNLSYGKMYFLPVIQDGIQANSVKSLIGGAIESYDEEGYAVPVSYQVAKVFSSINISSVFAVVALITIFILPNRLNDYTLYRGLTYEQVIMTTLGVAILLYTVTTTVMNRATYEVIDELVEVPNVRAKGIALRTFEVISIVVTVLLALSVIMGLLGIYLDIFNFLFNFTLIGMYILLTPMMLGVQTVIMKDQLGRYNIYLDGLLKEVM